MKPVDANTIVNTVNQQTAEINFWKSKFESERVLVKAERKISKHLKEKANNSIEHCEKITTENENLQEIVKELKVEVLANKPRSDLQWFSMQMEESLKRKDPKREWGTSKITNLLREMKEEIKGLQRAIIEENFKCLPEQKALTNIIHEASNAAVLAMMIADVCQTRIKNQTKQRSESL